MKSLLMLFALSGFLFLVPACGGDSHESMAEDMLDNLEEIADILEGCDNAEDLKAKKGELEDLSKKMEELAKKAKDMEKPSEERQNELKEKYEGRMGEAMQRIMKASMKLGSDAQGIIQEIMGNMR